MISEAVLATRNAGKVAELQALLPQWRLCSLSDVGITEDLEEPFFTFSENAAAKARAVYHATGLPSLADDSGLCVSALQGAPGVHSKRFAGEEAGDAENIRLLLERMHGLDNREAEFVAVLCYVDKNGEEHLFEGRCPGRIALEPAGTGGFGYDPVFIPDGYSQSFSELGSAEKNKISHRAKALQDFLKKVGS